MEKYEKPVLELEEVDNNVIVTSGCADTIQTDGLTPRF